MKRTRNSRRIGLSPLAWSFLTDAPLPDVYDGWELFVLQFDYRDPETGYRTADIWKIYSDEITVAWIKERPRTRPNCWWRYSAPKPRRNETEAAYLARHGLLTPDEKRRLKTDD